MGFCENGHEPLDFITTGIIWTAKYLWTTPGEVCINCQIFTMNQYFHMYSSLLNNQEYTNTRTFIAMAVTNVCFVMLGYIFMSSPCVVESMQYFKECVFCALSALWQVYALEIIHISVKAAYVWLALYLFCGINWWFSS
jgi:hypothetical protein